MAYICNCRAIPEKVLVAAFNAKVREAVTQSAPLPEITYASLALEIANRNFVCGKSARDINETAPPHKPPACEDDGEIFVQQLWNAVLAQGPEAYLQSCDLCGTT